MAIVRTTLDLYRAGNQNGGARLERFRPGEIVVHLRGNIDWILGPRQGGASTQDAPMGLRGTWYHLPKGIAYDDAIFYLWTDYPGHWSWEPAQDMRLSAYLDALRAMNADFIRL
jgi:hypothetical protein